MSEHWKPDDKATPLHLPRGGKRLRTLDEIDEWTRPQSYAPQPARRQALPPGALAGLILVAAACAGAVFVIDQAFGRRDVFAEEPPADRAGDEVTPADRAGDEVTPDR